MDFSAIEELLEPYRQGVCPGCAVTVTHKQAQIFSFVYGYADLENKIPIAADSNFRLASVTKQFTAAAVILLTQEKKLLLSQTLSDFFPDFPEYGRGISIYQLLTHTSGLVDYEDLIQEDDGKQVHDDQVLKLLCEQKNGYFLPGTQYRYSNGGYCLLRLIIEKVSSQSFAEYMKLKIFNPLGMSNTYVNEEGVTVIPNRVYGYSYKEGVPIKTDQDLTSATIGDGGIYSSINDMAKWVKIFYTNILLTAESKNQLMERRILTDEEDGSYYGFGLFMKDYNGYEILYHGGSSIGYKNGFLIVPEKELSITFLSNRNGGSGSGMAESIAAIVLSQVE